MKSFFNSKLFERYGELNDCKSEVLDAFDHLVSSFDKNGKLLVMGNGGSSADAEHISGELVKGFLLSRELSNEQRKRFDKVDSKLADNLQNGLPCISLGVSHSLISAFSNDLNWEYAFAQQVHVLANDNDIVLGISTSGNSKNIVNAMLVAKAKGLKTIALTGSSGGALSEIVDCCIKVPRAITHEVQELHLPVYHAICIELEEHYFGSK